MEANSIYKDISARTGGDIYIGVVGPVRSGKSLFIKKFMELMVIPNITDSNLKKRAIDELPQSGDGKMIMTTQPKFVPEKSVNVEIAEKVEANVRLVDCVGYMIDGATGASDDGKVRLVKTPWSDDDLPFDVAGEIGTTKVIKEYSTIGVLVTSDGSITEIGRGNYVFAEERAVNELKETGKPFVIVLNTKDASNENTNKMRVSLSEKYGVPVVLVNVNEMKIGDINSIFESVLNEFPIQSIDVELDEWVKALSYENWVVKDVVSKVKTACEKTLKMKDYKKFEELATESDYFECGTTKKIMLGEGKIVFEIRAKNGLYYKVLSEECGCEIKNDSHLIAYLKHLTTAKEKFDKVKNALEQVEHFGYGIVLPTLDEMKINEPEIVRQGNKYAVKIKASGASLHIMKVDTTTEVCPYVGSQTQSEELVAYMLSDEKNNPRGIWDTNMFGKSLDEIVNEGISNKNNSVPEEVREKMIKTMGRIVNEGKGGILCILL